MDHQTLERELSLDLDGRLPATRRSRLLAHLARDPEAQALADRMRKARELAQSHEDTAVGPQFHDSLMRRIRAGEGSPEAIFRSPVPVATKLRYLGVGAAAAAVMFLGLRLVEGTDARDLDRPIAARTATAENEPEGESLTRITPDEERFRPTFGGAAPDAGADLTAAAESPLRPASSLGGEIATDAELVHFLPGYEPLRRTTPANVTSEVVTSLLDSVGELRRRLELIPEDASPAQLRHRLSLLNAPIQRVQSATQWIDLLDRYDYIDVPSDAVMQLSYLRQATAQFQRGQARLAELPFAMGFARQQLQRVDLAALGESVKVACCTLNPSFDRWVAERLLELHSVHPGNAAPFRVVQLSDGRLVPDPGTLRLREEGSETRVQLLILPRGFRAHIQFGLPQAGLPTEAAARRSGR